MAEDIGAPLTETELDEFLQLGWTARLACLDDHGRPYFVPIWHQWDGERFWVIGSEHAIWERYLLASPTVALSIDNPDTVTRVMCQGRLGMWKHLIWDGGLPHEAETVADEPA